MISSPSARGDKIRNIKGTFVKIKIFTNLHRTTSPDAILYELGLHTQSFLTEEAGDVMSQTLRYFRSLQAHCLPDIETEPAVCSLEISLKFSIIPGEKKINLKFYLNYIMFSIKNGFILFF